LCLHNPGEGYSRQESAKCSSSNTTLLMMRHHAANATAECSCTTVVCNDWLAGSPGQVPEVIQTWDPKAKSVHPWIKDELVYHPPRKQPGTKSSPRHPKSGRNNYFQKFKPAWWPKEEPTVTKDADRKSLATTSSAVHPAQKTKVLHPDPSRPSHPTRHTSFADKFVAKDKTGPTSVTSGAQLPSAMPSLAQKAQNAAGSPGTFSNEPPMQPAVADADSKGDVQDAPGQNKEVPPVIAVPKGTFSANPIAAVPQEGTFNTGPQQAPSKQELLGEPVAKVLPSTPLPQPAKASAGDAAGTQPVQATFSSAPAVHSTFGPAPTQVRASILAAVPEEPTSDSTPAPLATDSPGHSTTQDTQQDTKPVALPQPAVPDSIPSKQDSSDSKDVKHGDVEGKGQPVPTFGAPSSDAGTPVPQQPAQSPQAQDTFGKTTPPLKDATGRDSDKPISKGIDEPSKSPAGPATFGTAPKGPTAPEHKPAVLHLPQAAGKKAAPEDLHPTASEPSEQPTPQAALQGDHDHEEHKTKPSDGDAPKKYDAKKHPTEDDEGDEDDQYEAKPRRGHVVKSGHRHGKKHKPHKPHKPHRKIGRTAYPLPPNKKTVEAKATSAPAAVAPIPTEHTQDVMDQAAGVKPHDIDPAIGSVEEDATKPLIVTLGDYVMRQGSFGTGIVTSTDNAPGWISRLATSYGDKAQIINKGQATATSETGVAMVEDLLKDYPDAGERVKLVVLSFGGNDAITRKGENKPKVTQDAYKANLKTMLTKLNDAGIKNVLLVTPPPAARRADRRFKTIKDYAKAASDLARSMKVPTVDLFAAVSSLPNWQAAVMKEDGLRLSERGQQLLYKRVMKALTTKLQSVSPSKLVSQ